MSKQEELLDFHKRLTDRARSIMEDKNNDYADADDPLKNFRACERLGVCSIGQGFMVRILDKLQRIVTFLEDGQLSVEDEPVEDAILDDINYLILLAFAIRQDSFSLDNDENPLPCEGDIDVND